MPYLVAWLPLMDSSWAQHHGGPMPLDSQSVRLEGLATVVVVPNENLPGLEPDRIPVLLDSHDQECHFHRNSPSRNRTGLVVFFLGRHYFRWMVFEEIYYRSFVKMSSLTKHWHRTFLCRLLSFGDQVAMDAIPSTMPRTRQKIPTRRMTTKTMNGFHHRRSQNHSSLSIYS